MFKTSRVSTMKRRLRFALGACASATAIAALSAAHAQEVEVIPESTPETIADDIDDRVVVTGSRIRRDEFTSIAPVQVVQGDLAREIGLIDATNLLQSSVQATGVQIDNTFNAFVLDNGPLATNVGLRGLGAQRTLTLLNSRRLGPGGVGGAPTAADLSLIPSLLIDQVDTLLDGASSVYGSDAVAGVVNILLRDDLDGFEFQGTYDHTLQEGGEEYILGAAWGTTTDRASIGLAVEYSSRNAITYGDRDFTPCEQFIEIDRNGVIRSDDTSLVPGTTVNTCKLSTINRVFIGGGNPLGNVWYTPGESNIGVANFSETAVDPFFSQFIDPSQVTDVDVDGDGVLDFGIIDPDGNGLTEVDLKGLYNFNGSSYDQQGHLVTPRDRISAYGYATYNLGNTGNTELFFEGLFSRRTGNVFSPGATIFPEVPSTNPTNPCNQEAGNDNCWGLFGVNFGSDEVTPILTVRGDRDFVEVETNQMRFVGGVRGDFTLFDSIDPLTSLGFSSWNYETFVSYNRVAGQSTQQGILERNLELAVNTTVLDPSTNQLVCGSLDANNDGIPETSAADDVLGRGGCVPVNLFADSLYQEGGGTFATQAETDYLFGSRDFDTTTEQLIIGGLLQGDLAQLPNGTIIPLVLGFEWRKDSVNSVPNDVAANGELFAFFSDAGAEGSRNLYELFAETSLTLLSDQPFAKDLTVEAAGRWTEESTFGAAITYSVRARYQPTDFLTFRGTFGTSFRAPNAEEQFLAGRSGFATISDPCSVPEEARLPGLNPGDPDIYDPSEDTRAQAILDNCNAQGIDPTAFQLDGGLPTYSVEVFSRGGDFVQAVIDPETSESWTAGFVFDQTFTDAFTFRLSGTYYEIEIQDSIAQLATQSIVNNCFGSQATQQDFFCRFIERDSDDFIDNVDSTFFNIARETSKGVDINMFAEKEFTINDRLLTVSLDVIANRATEQIFQFGEEFAPVDDVGTPSVPKWNGSANLIAEYDDFRFQWFTRFVQGGEAPFLDSDFTALGSTCEFLGEECRPFGRTDDYYTHSASVTWEPREDILLNIGVANLFDREPELVDNDIRQTTVLRNIPLGSGYDVFGRRIFFTARKTF